MVHWKFTGEKRPRTQEEWEEEFARYKVTPEYILHNQDMSLEEFKFIYYMEYAHRSLGRIIGVCFATGYIYFTLWKRKCISKSMVKQLTVLLGFGTLQGFIGWWMVKSGIDPEENKVRAHVSPYRLATHLVYAFALYTLILSTGYRALYNASRAINTPVHTNQLKRIKMFTH
uniref:Cytochrome c oxidase assembly protein COX15 n=1 Tax=Lygus hesperus TaxID=30085 RepID=A0A146LED2_LYGHE